MVRKKRGEKSHYSPTTSREKDVMIRTNHFKLEFTDESIYQYNVKITTYIYLIGKLKWAVIKKIKAELGNFLGGKSLAYDAGKNCIYTAGLLPFDSRTFIISLDDSEDNAMPTEKFTVYIKKIGCLDFLPLKSYLDGEHSKIPGKEIQISAKYGTITRLGAIGKRYHIVTDEDFESSLNVVISNNRSDMQVLQQRTVWFFVACEMCPDGSLYRAVTSYMCCLDSQIYNVDDVREFRYNDILLNRLGSHEKVANLLEELATNLSPESNAYRDTIQGMEGHSKRHFNNVRLWYSQFFSTHFTSPWTEISSCCNFRHIINSGADHVQCPQLLQNDRHS